MILHMNAGAAGAAAATAAAQAAHAYAIKASGAVVRVEPDEFTLLLDRATDPVVITSVTKNIFRARFQYLTRYKGFFFYAESAQGLPLPEHAEIISAKSIWTPT